MRLNLKVTMTDNTSHEVVAGVPDIVAWELRFKSKVSTWTNGVGMGDMTFVAWNSLSRQKKTALKYEEWLDSVVDIEYEEADPKATPAEA
jgi:hypothetical protein